MEIKKGFVPPMKAKPKRRERAVLPPNTDIKNMKCRACGERNSREWRRGPDGYKSLCNACGLHFAKLVKKEESLVSTYRPKKVQLKDLVS
jgi:hypothetical protein